MMRKQDLVQYIFGRSS